MWPRPCSRNCAALQSLHACVLLEDTVSSSSSIPDKWPHSHIVQGIADQLLDEHQTAQVARPGTSLARPMTGAAGSGGPSQAVRPMTGSGRPLTGFARPGAFVRVGRVFLLHIVLCITALLLGHLFRQDRLSRREALPCA